MRVIRDYQDGAIIQNYLHAAQDSSSLLVARAAEAWNEWEIQCLVMTSFTLQVFLLLSAPFRKRHRSRVLNGSIWVAYLMADYVATYLLGRLTLLVAVAGNGARQQLALFWAPFLLLHLGGQETITAFSMEDNTLWKRRLLDLAAQVAMAVYLVGKQWRGDDRLLVAPMALMFVCGAVRYGERIWALRAAAVRSPGSSSIASLADQASSYQGGSDPESVVMDHYKRLVAISSGDKLQASTIEPILKEASIDFQASLDFFMDVTPSNVRGFAGQYDELKDVLMELKSSKNGEGVAYKLAEVQVSLIHDYLYTKFGTVRFQAPKSSSNPAIWAAVQWLGSVGLTSAALALFARASNQYSGANAVISYILLVGALVIEISSIFIALVSSYWAGTDVAKHLHLRVGEWSGKLPQYNMIDACLEERERRRRQAAASGGAGSAIRWMLSSSLSSKTAPDVVFLSPEVMRLLLNKVLDIATDLRRHNWDFSRFRGEWAHWVANRVEGGGDPSDSDNDDDTQQNPTGPAHDALGQSNIQQLDLVSSVVLWHLVTSICLLAGDGPGDLTNPSKELSNYITYLVAKLRVMVDSDGHIVIARSQREVQGGRPLYGLSGHRIPDDFPTELHQEGFIQKLREGDKDYLSQPMFVFQESLAPSTARRVCVELLKIPYARDRWDLTAAVWTEILCYMALNCGAAFHAKHLTTGGIPHPSEDAALHYTIAFS